MLPGNGNCCFPFSRGLANSWSNQFGEQHKVWKEQIAVEEKTVKEWDQRLLLGYSKSQHNRRAERRGNGEITVDLFELWEYFLKWLFFSPVFVHLVSMLFYTWWSKNVFRKLLVQGFAKSITFQSLLLGQIFMYIFHYIFYSLFALQKEFLLLYLIWSKHGTGFKKGYFIETARPLDTPGLLILCAWCLVTCSFR